MSGRELEGVSRVLVMLCILTLVKKLHGHFHSVKIHQMYTYICIVFSMYISIIFLKKAFE